MEHSFAKHNRVSSIPYPEKIRITREFIAGTLNLEREAIGLAITKLTLRIHINNWIFQENSRKKKMGELSATTIKDERSFTERYKDIMESLILLHSDNR